VNIGDESLVCVSKVPHKKDTEGENEGLLDPLKERAGLSVRKWLEDIVQKSRQGGHQEAVATVSEVFFLNMVV
jgi:hypothetical protein